MKKQTVILTSVVILLAIFAFASFAFKDRQSAATATNIKTNQDRFIRDHSTIIGNKNAKVTIVEFIDPACETCAVFYPLVKDIMKKHDGKIRLVIRYAPFHNNADHVVKLLEATKKQGKYIEALEALLKYQSHWVVHHEPDIRMVWRVMASIGVDTNQLQNDIKDPKLDEILKQDLEDAKALGVNKTPGYFVNTKPLEPFGYENLVKLIESEL